MTTGGWSPDGRLLFLHGGMIDLGSYEAAAIVVAALLLGFVCYLGLPLLHARRKSSATGREVNEGGEEPTRSGRR